MSKFIEIDINLILNQQIYPSLFRLRELFRGIRNFEDLTLNGKELFEEFLSRGKSLVIRNEFFNDKDSFMRTIGKLIHSKQHRNERDLLEFRETWCQWLIKNLFNDIDINVNDSTLSTILMEDCVRLSQDKTARAVKKLGIQDIEPIAESRSSQRNLELVLLVSNPNQTLNDRSASSNQYYSKNEIPISSSKKFKQSYSENSEFSFVNYSNRRRKESFAVRFFRDISQENQTKIYYDEWKAIINEKE